MHHFGILPGLIVLKVVFIVAGGLTLAGALALKRAVSGTLENPIAAQLTHWAVIAAVVQTAAATHNCIEISKKLLS